MKVCVLALLLILFGPSVSQANDTPLVAVASSLRNVWPLLMTQYNPERAPRVTFGSSGNLARQITQGAPFNLLLSADQSYAKWLVDNDIANHDPVTYTYGKLAWVALPSTPLATKLESAQQPISDSSSISADITRLAIANPAFAPYGRAAQEVLNQSGSTPKIKFNLGENAAQALQFALSGATDGGIVPLSLVTTQARTKLPEMVVREIDSAQHQTLVHSMVLVGKPSTSTKALFDFLLSQSAQAIFERNGFSALE